MKAFGRGKRLQGAGTSKLAARLLSPTGSRVYRGDRVTESEIWGDATLAIPTEHLSSSNMSKMPLQTRDAPDQFPTWPPLNGGLTTPIVPFGSAILSVYGSTHIDAPASLVWQILLNTSAYPNWNTFCPRATIISQPQNVASTEQQILHKDTSFTFHVVMDSSKPTKVTDTRLRVTDISTPKEPSQYIDQGNPEEEKKTYTLDLKRVYRISWTTEGGFVSQGLKSERFNEIIDLGEGKGCEVRTWENQGGILARAVRYYYNDVLMEKFQGWCDELKAEAERRAE